jgi:hypothetical protein
MRRWARGMQEKNGRVGSRGVGGGLVGVGGEPRVAKAAAITLIFDPFSFLV